MKIFTVAGGECAPSHVRLSWKKIQRAHESSPRIVTKGKKASEAAENKVAVVN